MANKTPNNKKLSHRLKSATFNKTQILNKLENNVEEYIENTIKRALKGDLKAIEICLDCCENY